MANISESDVTLATVVASEALGALKANTVLSRVVNRDYEDEVAEHGQIVSIQTRGALTSNSKAQDTATTKQAPSTTATTVALDTHEEVTFIIEDTAKAKSRIDLLRGYMQDAIIVLAEKVDTDLAALYSGFTQTIDATATGAYGAVTDGVFREAQRQLNAAKAPQMARWAVLHEDAFAEASDIERLVNRDYAGTLADDVGLAEPMFLGLFRGFNVVMDQQIAVAASQAKNLFIQRDAIVMVNRPLPTDGTDYGVVQVVQEEDDFAVRVTLDYNTDHLGVQATIDVLFGVAELRDNHGVVVSSTEV